MRRYLVFVLQAGDCCGLAWSGERVGVIVIV